MSDKYSYYPLISKERQAELEETGEDLSFSGAVLEVDHKEQESFFIVMIPENDREEVMKRGEAFLQEAVKAMNVIAGLKEQLRKDDEDGYYSMVPLDSLLGYFAEGKYTLNTRKHTGK